MNYNLELLQTHLARRGWVSGVFGAVMLIGAGPASAIVYQNSTAQSAGLGAGQAYLNGTAQLIMWTSQGAYGGCSGSLVGGGAYVLTAAHCLTDETTGAPLAASIAISFANVGLDVTATAYVVNPDWNGSIEGGGDLALIKLNTPILSIASYALGAATEAWGGVVTLAGYGFTGVGAAGYVNDTFGTLRAGENTFDIGYFGLPWIYGYDFDQYGDPNYNLAGVAGVGSTEAMIAPGDSGGPSLVYENGAWTIVAVHEFFACIQNGCTPNSSFGQLGGDTSVYTYQDWLNSILTPVPESSTWALMGLGFLGLCGVSLRGARSVATRPC